MKKVLFATTALIATAGMVAADGHAGVTLSGSSRFGVTYDEGRTEETKVQTRFTLNIDASVETDSGAEFFSRVRVRGENETGEGDSTSASGVSAPRVGVRVGGFTVAAGNILGALESTPNLYGGSVGLTGLSYSNLPLHGASTAANMGGNRFFWDSFSSAGGGVNGVEVIYSNAGFGLHLSHSEVSQETAIHLSYNFGDWTVAVAASDDDDAAMDEEAFLLTIAGSLGAADVGLKIADVDIAGSDDVAATIYGSFDVGAGTEITAYASVTDHTGADDAFGIGFTHSLGGAVLAGGIASEFDGDTEADFGVRFSF